MNSDNQVEERSLTVEYALTRREIFRFSLRSVAESPKFRGTILLYSAAIDIFTLLLRVVLSGSFALKDVIIAVACAVCSPVFFSLWAFIRGKTAKRELTISSDGVATEIGPLKGRIPWDKIRAATDTPRFVLIARTNGNAFFIPHRAFSGPEHREHFLAEIKRWMHART